MAARGQDRRVGWGVRAASWPRVSLLGTTALATSLTLVAAAGPALAGQKPVLPSGGGFVAGAGAISASGSTLTVTQSSLRGIINWNSFSIGRGGLVSFQNGSGATLNRVTGAQQSQLLGTLSATGSVYLLNPNGVLIGKSGVVNTGGSFLASTLDTSDAAFMSGGGVVLAGGSAASVRNYGTIAATGGNVFLVARTVLNSGSIAAANGEAGLAGGQQVLLQDSASDPRIFVEAPGGDVTNKGKIAAAAVALKAAGGNVYALAGNNGGQISATGTAVINGHVWLTASGGGSVAAAGQVSAQNADGSGGTVTVTGGKTGGSATVTGTVDVAATAPGKSGGTAVVDAASVTVAGSAVINASGTAAGGHVLVGVTAPHGKGLAQRTTIATGAQILAQGGTSGGSTETSGRSLFLGAATVNAGSGGSWLLDPTNLTIDAAAAGTIEGSLNAGTSVTEQTTASGASGAGTQSSGPGDIIVAAGISWTGTGTLTLSAYNDIAINAAISGSAGGLTLSAAGSITTAASGTVNVGTFILQSGAWSQVSASLPSFSATNFELQGGSFLRATGGAGSSASPYQIVDVYGLQGIGTLSMSNSYVLANTIDATLTSGWNGGAGFVPIGASTPFSGSLNGQGYTINGLTINLPSSNYVGLFAQVAPSGTVSNLGLTNAAITGNFYVGALAGSGAGTISGSYSTGAVNGSAYADEVGGLVGFNAGGTIAQSYSTAAVSGSGSFNRGAASVGGLVGYNTGTIAQSYSTGAVNGGSNGGTIGGLVGENYSGGIITQSYSTGTVGGSGAVDLGGLVGHNFGSITRSYSVGAISASGGDTVGGLVGSNEDGTITQCYSTITVSGSDTVGGLVGSNEDGTVTQSFSTGAVSGSSGVGGLAGSNEGGTIAQSYSTGAVSASGSQAGGLVGFNAGAITQSYSTGAVSGSSYVGGLVGDDNTGTVSADSFWDKQSSGQNAGAGGSFQSTFSAQGLTTAQAQSESYLTGLGWTFAASPNSTNPSAIVDGASYPYLAWRYASGVQVVSGTAPSAGATVNLVGNGTSLGSVTAGANGFYYFLLGAGTMPSNGAVLTYLSGGTAANAVAPLASATGSDGTTSSFATGLALSANTVNFVTPATTLSAALPTLSQALGGDSGSAFLYSVPGGTPSFNSGVTFELSPTAASFTIDTPASLPNNTLALNAAGAVTQTAPITTPALELLGAGATYTLTNSSNSIGTLAASVGSGTVDLVANGPLAIGTVNGVSGVSAGTLTLNAGGTISDTSAPVAVGSFILQGGNWSQVSASLPSFSASSDFELQGGSFLRALSGDGTDTPYAINDIYGLQGIGTLAMSNNYVLATNIDASGTASWNAGAGFAPIGYSGSSSPSSFSGSFDGAGHTINALTIDRTGTGYSGDYIGLFSVISGTVGNVGVTNVNVASLSGGALAGAVNGGTISNSYSTGTVTGNDVVGGLVGYTERATIEQSYSTAAVTGSGTSIQQIGGLVGANGSGSRIEESYSTGAVTAPSGIYVGGLVGWNFLPGGTIIQSYSSGAVSGGSNVGGLAGGNVGGIEESYSTGTVTGTNNVGGLVGVNSGGTLTQTYSTGAVSSSGTLGGLVGLNSGSVAADSFWDVTTSGQANGVGSNSGTFNGQGLTTAQFQDTAGFMANAGAQGWDFTSVWAPPSAGYYPQLYALSPVVYVATPNTTSTYGTAPAVAPTIYGGPASYVFGPAGDSLATPAVGAGLGATTNVGSYALTGAPSATSGDGVSYRVVYTGTLTVDPATLTYAANAASRTYGGANPAFTGTVTGFVNGETLASATTGTLSFASLATTASNVGSYAITGSGLTANSGNYVFVQGAGNATALTINPATLTYAADTASRTYGAANPSFTGTVTGFVNGETLTSATTGTVSFASAATASSNVGSYAIIGAGLTANHGNYVFLQAAGDATALKINPATLTYAADAVSRTYGAANPSFTGTVTGFVNGETLASATTGTVSFGSAATASSNVGSYAVTGSGLSANNGNYVFAQAVGNASALTINPATLTYAADAVSRTYGAANPGFTGTVTGFVNGETLASATTGTLGFASAASASSNVGSYAITGSGLSANNGNYVLAQAAGNASALTINPATLIYAANAASRTYGAANPAFTGTVTGFVNGETLASATTGTLSFSSPAIAGSNVGSYAINGSGLAANNGDYVFMQAAGNATALTINPATLTYAADAVSRTYGAANPGLTGTVTGFVNGDTQASATTGTASFASTATASSNVGSYAVNGSGLAANNGNYVFVQAAGNATALTINPATLSYVADAASRIYGAANPGFTGTVTGFVNGDTLTTTTSGAASFSSTATASSNVGSYAIAGSGLTLTTGNYVLAQAAGNATALTINPATLTYVADAASRSYGAANPSFTGTVTGFVNGEALASATTGTVSFASAATASNNVGRYAITGAGLTANYGNYVFVQAAGNTSALTINPATLTYVATPATRPVGAPNPVFTGTITGYVDGDTQATATLGTLAFTTPATPLSGVGRYAIDGSGLRAVDGNYVFAEAPANAAALSVTPVSTVTVMPPTSPQLIGQLAIPSFRFSLAGLLANLAPLAGGCVPTPGNACAANQPLAQSSFSPMLPGSDGDRAPPVQPW